MRNAECGMRNESQRHRSSEKSCKTVFHSALRIPHSALDLRCVAILVLLVVAIRGWQITHTEVASRDSISYIRIAWQLENGPWRQVFPSSPQHPGYPLAVLGMSLPVRHFLPDDLPHAWQLSAQLVSALASVLLLVPMYFFGREVFDRRIAFWSCVLFQCLPTSGKIMSDALSDTLFLLFACSGLWLASLALRRNSWRCSPSPDWPAVWRI